MTEKKIHQRGITEKEDSPPWYHRKKIHSPSPRRSGEKVPKADEGPYQSPRPREDAPAAHEVVRCLLHAVHPPPHLRQFRPLQDLGDAVGGEVADDVVLVVVLAAEDALAVRRDVQVLERP